MDRDNAAAWLLQIRGWEPVRIGTGIEMLALGMGAMGPERIIHPVVLWDDEAGATLVDTGAPGETAALAAALAAIGLDLADVRRVILTHQDMDHIGNAADVVRRSGGAEVAAHAADAPYIRGELPPIKMPPERVRDIVARQPEQRRAEVERLFSPPPSVRIDHLLADGEVLPIHGGIRVVHTPGHTPGHVSLYLEAPRLLISGDALRVEAGELLAPNPANTPDMATAMRSLARLAELPAASVVCYHGGVYGPDAAARLRQLAG